jgi:hypothetical protein
MPHDILVFYCGLTPYPPDGMPRLFAIGYFRVKAVHRVSARDGEARRKLQYRFGNTVHFVLRVPDRELVLVLIDNRNMHKAALFHDRQDILQHIAWVAV